MVSWLPQLRHKTQLIYLKIMETHEYRCVTLIASQLEPNEWYLRIEGELMANPILNRIAMGAMFIEINGPSIREYITV